jgi:hypothetical protein
MVPGVSAAEQQARNFLTPADPKAPSKQRTLAAEATAAARTHRSWKTPVTSWGHPDLQGVWTSDDMRSVPLIRPKRYGMRESLTAEEFLERASLDEGARDRALSAEGLNRNEVGVRTFGYSSLVIDPPDGQIPALTPTAVVRWLRRGRTGHLGPYKSMAAFSLNERCITRGVLGSLLPGVYGNGVRIVQTPTAVVLNYEIIHETRIVPLDRKSKLDAAISQYMGSSNGHWDGDTLVIETSNFTDATSVAQYGDGPQHSAAMTITERLRRVDPDMIDYSARIEDPLTYTKPFTIRMTITRQPGYQMYEFACHEGNRFIENAISAQSAYEKKAAEAAALGLPPPKQVHPGNAIYTTPDESAGIFDVNANTQR